MEKIASANRENARAPRYVPGGGIRTGDRVELHPATEWWMRGARYGDVVKLGNDTICVRLDRTGRVHRFLAEELTLVL